MNPSPAKNFDAAQCPLCGQPNDCQLCTNSAYKGPCWCAQVEIPEALLARVPAELKNKSCICRNCVMEFHRAKILLPPELKSRRGAKPQSSSEKF